MLELKNIFKSFALPSGKGNIEILKDLSLMVNTGEPVAVIGPSGSGKSTFLNIAGALDQPSAGDVIIDGENLSSLNEDELADLRNKKIGFIFQLHHLLPQCTVLENVLIPVIPQVKNINQDVVRKRALKLLARVGLQERSDYYPAQLSGGELQRVAVVRALINEPKIILADEPTGSLDHKSAFGLTELLLELNQEENVTLVMVTHSNEIAKKIGKTYLLKNGRLELT